MEQDLIQERNAQIQELASKLIRENTVYDLATELATYIIKDREKKDNIKIAVTDEEFTAIQSAIQSLFRVKGIRANGQEERRGRPRLIR